MKYAAKQGLAFSAEPPPFIQRLLGQASGHVSGRQETGQEAGQEEDRRHLRKGHDNDDEAPVIVGLDSRVSLDEARGFLSSVHPSASIPDSTAKAPTSTSITDTKDKARTTTVIHLGSSSKSSNSSRKSKRPLVSLEAPTEVADDKTRKDSGSVNGQTIKKHKAMTDKKKKRLLSFADEP